MFKKLLLTGVMALPLVGFTSYKTLIADAAAESEQEYIAIQAADVKITSDELQIALEPYFKKDEQPEFSSFPAEMQLEVAKKLAFQRMVVEEAEKAGVRESDEVKNRLKQLEDQVLMEVYLTKKAEESISEEELKKAYDTKAAEIAGKEEVQARHILVKTEQEAKDVVKALKDGGDFAELAQEKSQDPGSAFKGGDLGWFQKESMVKPFADAAFALEKGTVSEPVKSEFGWHIIQVEDKRKTSAPAFEDMKPRLEAEKKQQFLSDYYDTLLGSADIKFYNPDGSVRELSPAAGAPKAE